MTGDVNLAALPAASFLAEISSGFSSGWSSCPMPQNSLGQYVGMVRSSDIARNKST